MYKTGIDWTSKGVQSANGTQCERWESVHISICVGLDGAPVQLTDSRKSTSPIPIGSLSYTFSDAELGPVDASVFEQTPACVNYPIPPCDSTKVVTENIFRLHGGGEPLILDERNFGNLMGQPTIVCDWNPYGQFVSMWELTASSSYGQYGRCHYNASGNLNYCDAHTGTHVGREAPDGVGFPTAGQCTPNLETGSWLSFPAGGKCADGAPVGTDGCMYLGKRLRTVHAECVNSPGLQKACSRFFSNTTKSAEVAAYIKSSFADPTQGGCPEADPKALALAAQAGPVHQDEVRMKSLMGSRA